MYFACANGMPPISKPCCIFFFGKCGKVIFIAWLLALTLLPVPRVLGSVQFGLSCDIQEGEIGLRLCSPLMSLVC